MSCHRRLFGLEENCYCAARQDITESILLSAGGNIVKLHIVTGWMDMLKVALWTSRKPSRQDVLGLLEKISALPAELSPVGANDMDHIQRMLYDYGRLDVFRKVCRAAKGMAESVIRREKLAVHCHMVIDGGAGIVASSL